MKFIVTAAMQDVANAIGLQTPMLDVPPCAMQVGDFITYPSRPELAFRVTARLFRAAEPWEPGEWWLYLEPSPQPEDLQKPAPR